MKLTPGIRKGHAFPVAFQSVKKDLKLLLLGLLPNFPASAFDLEGSLCHEGVSRTLRRGLRGVLSSKVVHLALVLDTKHALHACPLCLCESALREVAGESRRTRCTAGTGQSCTWLPRRTLPLPLPCRQAQLGRAESRRARRSDRHIDAARLHPLHVPGWSQRPGSLEPQTLMAISSFDLSWSQSVGRELSLRV